MKSNIRRTILITAGITFVSVILLCLIGYFIVLFAFPKNLGDFYLNLGCDNMASSLYHKVYEKNGDIYYCYKGLQLKINVCDYPNIIDYYEDFIGDEEYNKFIKDLNMHNENLNVGILEKSIFLDEINYINSNYINALNKIGESEKALEYSINLFKVNNELTLKNIGNYNFSTFINKDFEYNKFVDNKIGENSLLFEMQEYFDNCVELFNSNLSLSDNLSKSYLMMIGNRIISVGEDVNTIYNHLNINNTELNINLNTMDDINNKVMGLIR